MKRLILILVVVLGALAANAQQKLPTAKELAKKNIDELETRLTLNGTQKGIIYNYVYDLAKQQVALFNKQQAGTYQNEDGTKYFRVQNETNTQIKTVLKPEQITEFNKLIEERLSGIDPKKKKKKLKKGEEEDKVVGIEGLKSVQPVNVN